MVRNYDIKSFKILLPCHISFHVFRTLKYETISNLIVRLNLLSGSVHSFLFVVITLNLSFVIRFADFYIAMRNHETRSDLF